MLAASVVFTRREQYKLRGGKKTLKSGVKCQVDVSSGRVKAKRQGPNVKAKCQGRGLSVKCPGRGPSVKKKKQVSRPVAKCQEEEETKQGDHLCEGRDKSSRGRVESSQGRV